MAIEKSHQAAVAAYTAWMRTERARGFLARQTPPEMSAMAAAEPTSVACSPGDIRRSGRRGRMAQARCRGGRHRAILHEASSYILPRFAQPPAESGAPVFGLTAVEVAARRQAGSPVDAVKV